MVTTRRQSAAASQAHQAAAAGATAQAPDTVAANGSAKHVESKTWAQTAGTGDRNSFLGLTGPLGYAVALCGALLLMAVCPAVVIYTYQIHSKFDGSVVLFGRHVLSRGFSALVDLWPLPSITAWRYYAVFGVFEAFLQLALPGAVFLGPTTPKGNVPRYKANGVLAYVTTLVAFFALWWFGGWDPANIYDNFAELMSASNIFSLGLCAFLYVKGHLFPSSSDSGTTGSLVYDVFWGVELYPRIGKHFDIKTWTNCRMGMMSWAVISLSFPFAQLRDTGSVSNSILVSAVVMNVYVFKFFLWETGYWRTMDIAHDRAGYYLCWGCLNWLPCIYTSPAMYLVNHPLHLHPALALAFTGAGLLMVYINYAADCQRQEFRAADGRIRIWGREPVIVRAKYATGNGEEKVSLLLASGWWGVARHFHYVPEILASFFWTVPCLFSHLLPYFYVIYLTLLLLDRSFRDDTRCRSKYGKYWDEYCRLVPWKIIPFIF